METDFVKLAGFVVAVFSLIFTGRQCALVPSLSSKAAVMSSATDVAATSVSLMDGQPMPSASVAPAILPPAHPPPAAPKTEISSTIIEHIHSSAVKDGLLSIPADGRIWRSQATRVSLTDHNGSKVHFFKVRVLMFNSHREKLLDNAFDIPAFDLLPKQKQEIGFSYPERIIKKANDNWADDTVVKIDRIITLLEGTDDKGAKVLVNIENGDITTHPLPYEFAGYF